MDIPDRSDIRLSIIRDGKYGYLLSYSDRLSIVSHVIPGYSSFSSSPCAALTPTCPVVGNEITKMPLFLFTVPSNMLEYSSQSMCFRLRVSVPTSKIVTVESLK